MTIHKCGQMPEHLYIEYSKWAGGWCIFSKRMNNALMWDKIRYCPYCGKCLDEIELQMSILEG